jgi:flavin-dependent dehydrogenase
MTKSHEEMGIGHDFAAGGEAAASEGGASEGRASEEYDVVVIGGAVSGASLALLLRRWLPATRLLIVEREEVFGRKVGEATVEVSGMFLHRVLGLYDMLSREHLPKHGLRFWFTDGPERSLLKMSEVGSGGIPHLPSFQLDRARLDGQILALAEAEGAAVLRPAKVLAVEHGWPQSRVRLEDAGGTREVSARWVIDASGKQAFLARRMRLLRRVEEHPIAAIWGRWKGAKDLDGPAILGQDPRQPGLPRVSAARRLATNHFCGYGWWCWVIPLAGGETSVGLVYNKEILTLPGVGCKLERYRHFVTSQPGLRELLAAAELLEKDTLSYGHLPYTSSKYMAPGWALLGDAAGFLDPFYSPGLDHVGFSVYATARILEEDLGGRLAGEELEARIATHNGNFERSYRRWMEALYLGKYEIFGDAELTACAFLVDTALYYMGVVTPVDADVDAFCNPPFGLDIPAATFAHRFMRTFNRRMTRIARFRRLVGLYGRRNVGWHFYSKLPGLGRHSTGMLVQGLRLWLKFELGLLAYRLRNWGKLELSEPVPTALGEPAQTT